MEPALLLLLDEQRAKAALAWQYVTRYPRSGEFRVKAARGVFYRPSEWMDLAGLPSSAHDRVAPILFRAELVKPDGSVAIEVLAYARRVVAQRAK